MAIPVFITDNHLFKLITIIDSNCFQEHKKSEFRKNPKLTFYINNSNAKSFNSASWPDQSAAVVHVF